MKITDKQRIDFLESRVIGCGAGVALRVRSEHIQPHGVLKGLALHETASTEEELRDLGYVTAHSRLTVRDVIDAAIAAEASPVSDPEGGGE